jgi:phosphatidylglycerol---prolipoprotein diacylglyceryl transferase
MQLLAIAYPKINPVAFWLPLPEVTIHWPVTFQIGPLAVKWYGLAYVAGLLLGRFYVKALLQNSRLWLREKPPFAPEQVDDLLLYMTAGVLLGGRLGYVLFYQPYYFLTHPFEIVAVWNGGMAFHGALVGSIVAMLLFARHLGADIWSVMDASAAATPMGLFFGRLANFINAELWGRPSTVSWAMVFPGADDMPRHPSQLYEALTEGLVLFVVLWWLTYRQGALRRPGIVCGTFLAGYGLARSLCELFREPDAGHYLTIGPLTAGIFYSLPMVLAGLLIIRAAVRRVAVPADVQS